LICFAVASVVAAIARSDTPPEPVDSSAPTPIGGSLSPEERRQLESIGYLR